MIAEFTQPDNTTQFGNTYKTYIDAAIAVLAVQAAAFAAHGQSTPDMTVAIDAGSVWNVDTETLTAVAAQNSAAITAPVTDPRKDIVYIDESTGTVGVAAGTEAATPADPAIPAGKIPVARINLTVAMTTIANSIIDDLRPAIQTGWLKPDGDGSGLTGISTTDPVARANIVLNAFRIAVNGGLSVQNMVDGVIDEFEDETGVGTATGATYDTTDDLYLNSSAIAQATGTAIGTMTKNGGLAAAFDGNITQTGVQSAMIDNVDETADARNVGKDWGTGVTKSITSVKLYAPTDGAGFSTNVYDTEILLQHSSDGITWTDAGTTGVFTPAAGDIKTITATDTTARQYHRVCVWQAGQTTGNQNFVAELEFVGAPSDMTLISNATTALATPTEAFIVLWEEDVDAVTLNTDLIAYASRDGGTTWTQITLAEEAVLSTGRILTGTVDISAQPSGTSMMWKVTTLNAKELKVHGVGLEWS